MPKLSVVIPAFNVEKYIKECLDPIIEFRGLDFEIIVVNDASTDGTLAILNQYNDKRLKIINHKINRGLPAARNTGFKASSGEYIIPLDSDDIPIPRSWLMLLSLIEKTDDVSVVYGYAQLFKDGSEFVPNFNLKFVKPSGYILDEIVIHNNFISIGTAIISRKSIVKVGEWNESLTIGEDWEMWCRLAEDGKFMYYESLVVGYRQRKSSMTKSQKYTDETKLKLPLDLIFNRLKQARMCEKKYQELRKTAFSNFHYRMGMKKILGADYICAVRHLLKSFSLRPSKILYLLNYPFRSLKRKLMHGYL